VKTYGYDLAGRTTSVVSSTGTTNIAYDFEERATSIVGPGVSQTNLYNGLDKRVGSTTNSVARTYLRDGAYVTDPVLKDGAATYTPGVSERRGTTTTYLHSGLKNADAQSSPAQLLTGTRQYDAFGNLATSTGTWTGPFGYAGAFGYQEDATGLKLLGHRLYDASTGRFLTRDPIKDGRNWYLYGENDPVNRIDPEGLKNALIVLGAVDGWYQQGVQQIILNHLIAGLEKDGYDVTIIIDPTKDQFLHEAGNTDALVVIGHGTNDPGGPFHGMPTFQANGDDPWNLDADVVRALKKRRNHRRLNSVRYATCYGWSQGHLWSAGFAGSFAGNTSACNQYTFAFPKRRIYGGGRSK